MKFSISLKTETLQNVLRTCNYAPDGADARTGELRFFRSARGGKYPRFHIYAQGPDDNITLNIHLDQKQQSYEGSSAHSGEYDGPLLEQEIARILSIV
ncbi:MAG: hypothetical protein O3C23_03070 [bacterium]|nr:hypothetical protein [bacterium]